MIENGSWAPTAKRAMTGMLEGMKNLSICENNVTIMSVMKDKDIAAMETLADELLSE